MMLHANEAYKLIGEAYKAMHAHESKEAALSTNKPWITASKVKIKRDAPEHVPIEGDHPETYASLTRRTLHNVANVLIARRARMESGSHEVKSKLGSAEHEARRKAVLSEVDVSPLELAFLFDYAREESVRELRIRNGLDENTGRPLKDKQRPIISDRKRARR